jgi:hypothetical protein
MKALLLCLCLASLSPHPAPTLPESPAAVETPQFVLAPDADVQLDGRPCAFADVPADAVIELLAVAADKKTILKVHFKSKRP